MTDKLPKIVYAPKSQVRTPGIFLRSMIGDLIASRELAWRLFVRDLFARYRQSIFGVLWAFLPPILTGMVFIVLQNNKLINLGQTDIPYPVFVLFGTTLWQVFTESLNAPLISVGNARPMLAKINFPREALIISSFYQILFNVLIKSLVLVAVFLYFDIQASWGLLLAPLAMLILILFGMAIGLLLTPLGMLFTDVSYSLTFFTQIWFFLTPVVYPPPKSFPYSLLATVNPVSPIIVATRDLATKGVMTNVPSFLIVSMCTFVGLLVAWIIYRLALPIIIERMSA